MSQVAHNDIEPTSYEHETRYFTRTAHVHFLTNSGHLIMMIWSKSGQLEGHFREIRFTGFVRIPTCLISR